MTQYTSDMKRFCAVYKSPKKQEMYLYVDRKEGIESLPEGLQQLFGRPEHVLDMILTPTKKLARVEAENVLKEIAENGFFLQMPPVNENEKAGDAQAPKDSLNG